MAVTRSGAGRPERKATAAPPDAAAAHKAQQEAGAAERPR
jgi:hypothetical protein